jgi:hypothetical protein
MPYRIPHCTKTWRCIWTPLGGDCAKVFLMWAQLEGAA